MLDFLFFKSFFAKSLRPWLRDKLPVSLRRQKNLRKFGSINELYFWRIDGGIDTVAPIQNYFSSLFPSLKTATKGKVWIFDQHGAEITTHEFKLPHQGTHVVRIGELVGCEHFYGTFMWQVCVPEEVARHNLIPSGSVYFTDRGYICYEKNNCQPAFIHGVDRYAVFQGQEMEASSLFYRKSTLAKPWIPEFPVVPNTQIQLDVIILNRTDSKCECSIVLYRNGGEKIYESATNISPRGCSVLSLDGPILRLLENETGYFMVTGLPTTWGRPAIMRHFNSGAISVIHC